MIPFMLKHQQKKLREQAEAMMEMVIKRTSNDECEAFEAFLQAPFVQIVREKVDAKAALAALTGIEEGMQRRGTGQESGGTHTK